MLRLSMLHVLAFEEEWQADAFPYPCFSAPPYGFTCWPWLRALMWRILFGGLHILPFTICVCDLAVVSCMLLLLRVSQAFATHGNATHICPTLSFLCSWSFMQGWLGVCNHLT